MATSLLDTFRVLSSFDPPKRPLADAPWDDFVEWAIVQGLAPLAAYNLEYRLGGAGSPEWARDRLLSVYQGALNDNVMKLVNFKRSIDELEGRKVLVLGGPAFAESLYPHVAFRPVLEIELWVGEGEAQGLAGYLGRAGFKPAEDDTPHAGGRVVSDGRTQVRIHERFLGKALATEEAALFARALPMKVYGPSMFRPTLEDAVVLSAISLARAGFEVPVLSLVDMRELILGAPSMGGAYSRALDGSLVRARAKAWGAERAVHVASRLVERFFPETKDAAEAMRPKLGAGTRAVLERLVVSPLAETGKVRQTRGAEQLRRLLFRRG